MRITRIIKTGIIGTLMTASLYSCKKAPFVEKQDVPQHVSTQLLLLKYRTGNVLRDKRYKLYGYDTVEVNRHFYGNQIRFLEGLQEKAVKKTPKKEIGQRMEFQMFPKSGGGFDQIPVMKMDYKPEYKDQKIVVTSDKVFTRDGEDIYIPIAYYGQENN